MTASGTTAAAAETTLEPGPGAPEAPPKKKGRTNTPWTAEEEQRLKTMRDAGRSWSEIAKRFEEGLYYHTASDSMQSMALREAIKEYEASKWKVIGQKVGKPAKVRAPEILNRVQLLTWIQACEQYAKEHFKDL
ncbi:hypothetical protein APSETT445_003378 [Aspergillus pseudonomiae]